MTIADVLFLSRAMGAPVPGGADPVKWCGAALANPERRAAAHAHIEALIGQLPTEEDAARTPIKVPRRNAVPVDPETLVVRDGNGDALGRWHKGLSSNGYRAKYVGRCPCESGEMFQDCHGADESNAAPIAANAGNAQDAPGEEPT